MLGFTEEIFDAEQRYELSNEDDDLQVDSSPFCGLRKMNATRWNSLIKMGQSQLKYKGFYFDFIDGSHIRHNTLEYYLNFRYN